MGKAGIILRILRGDGFSMESQMIYRRLNHGAGIFTYKTGPFFLGFLCGETYSSTMVRIWVILTVTVYSISVGFNTSHHYAMPFPSLLFQELSPHEINFACGLLVFIINIPNVSHSGNDADQRSMEFGYHGMEVLLKKKKTMKNGPGYSWDNNRTMYIIIFVG